MENKINVSEILKDCPAGMGLDCTLYDDVEFMEVDTESDTIILRIGNKFIRRLNKYGQNDNNDYAKCVIFPKGKTTWEGFVPPCKFNDGDVVAFDTEKGVQLFIFRKYVYNRDSVQCYMMLDYDGKIDFEGGDYYVERLATKEEKQKLFDAIKANGYKWNAETKTPEKLIIPKFHEGQWITNGYTGGQIISIENKYPCYKIANFIGGISTSIPFTLQDDYRLWTIQDAKDGDVLSINWHVDDDSLEKIIIFKKYHNQGVKGLTNEPCVEGYGNTFKNGKLVFNGEVPYYSKTWTANLQPATKEEKQKLFDAIKANGYKWNAETKTPEKLIIPKFKVGDRIRKENNNSRVYTINGVYSSMYGIEGRNFGILIEDQDEYELVHNKFDIKTLKPFDKVLVRDSDKEKWNIDFFSYYRDSGDYQCMTFVKNQCIPYENNEHLLGKKDDCSEYYKTWK